MTGYSGTPLTAKLGIVPGSTLVVLDDPGHADALLAPLPDGVVVRRRLGGHADVVLIFAPGVPYCPDGLASVFNEEDFGVIEAACFNALHDRAGPHGLSVRPCATCRSAISPSV